ncbi:hypothetical protein DIU36_16795 [Mucilaginibacter rubeus]|nr:hypothetical protein DIU36_16795 [Mucilaginibacter rubeus]
MLLGYQISSFFFGNRGHTLFYDFSLQHSNSSNSSNLLQQLLTGKKCLIYIKNKLFYYYWSCWSDWSAFLLFYQLLRFSLYTPVFWLKTHFCIKNGTVANFQFDWKQGLFYWSCWSETGILGGFQEKS